MAADLHINHHHRDRSSKFTRPTTWLSLADVKAIITLVRQSNITKRMMRTNMRIYLSDPLQGADGQAGAGQGDLGLGPGFDLAEATAEPNSTLQSGTSSWFWRGSRGWRIPGRSSTESDDKYGQLHDKVSAIASRISLYPVSLIVMNVVQVVGDIYFNDAIDDAGVNKAQLNLYVVYRIFNASRGLVLALVSHPVTRRREAAESSGELWQGLQKQDERYDIVWKSLANIKLCLLCDPCLKRVNTSLCVMILQRRR